MKERPLLCADSVVRNIIAKRQTQDRRPMKPQPYVGRYGATHKTMPNGIIGPCEGQIGTGDYHVWSPKPNVYIPMMKDCLPHVMEYAPWQPGDRLWVRERFTVIDGSGREKAIQYAGERDHVYLEDPRDDPQPMREGGWPSIHMPRWASRITLEVLWVWVERVQEISEEDAIAEGMSSGCLNCGSDPCDCHSPQPCYRDSFIWLWGRLYGNWSANPWVWCCEFKLLEAPK